MHFHLDTQIRQPLGKVSLAVRDHMCDVAKYIPDIESIQETERAHLPHGLRVVNLWQAKIELPALARDFIKPEMLRWIDTAQWDEQGHHCSWHLDLPYFEGAVHCNGQTRLEPAILNRTKVVFEGNLKIGDLKGFGGPFSGMVTKVVEGVMVKLIPENFKKISLAVEQFLAEHPH
jgi:hypothetical protein